MNPEPKPQPDDFFPAPSIDPMRIELLRSLETPKNPGQVHEILLHYLADTQSQLEDLKFAIKNHDFIQLKKLAHTMKGVSANLGITRMAKLCAEMEKASVSQNSSLASQLCQQLILEFIQVRPKLDRWLNPSA